MTIPPAGTKLFHADGQTDRYDETNSLLRNFVNAPKNYLPRGSYVLKRMCQIYF